MRVIYIANDGTKFDDEWECLDYEQAQRMHSMRILNDGLQETTDLDTNCEFFRPTNRNNIEYLERECGCKGSNVGEWEVNRNYVWSEERGGFIDLDDYITELEADLAHYKEAKKRLEEVR